MAERPHVLYVDDVKEITDLMTVALGSEGFDVTVANDGQAAIEALSGKPKIDAIVLDYMMCRSPKLRRGCHILTLQCVHSGDVGRRDGGSRLSSRYSIRAEELDTAWPVPNGSAIRDSN